MKLMPNLHVNRKSLIVHREHKQKIPDERYTMNHKHGFTLIELLIVITIIGILASLPLASYSGTQQKARDGVRKSDLAQIKRALELAKSDCSGNAFYPGTTTPGTTIAGAVNDYNNFLKPYLPAAALKYISSVPVDPQNSGSQQYGYNVGGSTLATACPDSAGTPSSQAGYGDYLLAVLLEKTSDADAAKSANNCSTKPNFSNYTGNGWYFVCNN